MEDSQDEFVVTASQAKQLTRKRDDIERKFSVLLKIPQEENDGMIWIRVRGNIANVTSAKTYVKAICNPDAREIIWMHQMPRCVFTAFTGFWHDQLEFKFCVLIKYEHSSYKLQGSQMQVVQAVSYLMELHKMATDYDNPRISSTDQSVVEFNNKISNAVEDQVETLLALSPALKKELLGMINSAGREFSARITIIKQGNDAIRDRTNSVSSAMATYNDSDVEVIEVGATADTPGTSRAFADDDASTNGHLDGGFDEQAKFIKRTMKQIGFEDEHIEILLRRHGGHVTFDDALKELHRMKEKKLLEARESPTPDLMSFPSPSDNMNDVVIVSSEDEDDDDVIYVDESKKTTTNKSTTKSTNKSTHSKFPEIIEIEQWLKNTYEVTNIGKDSVNKREMLKDFINHFKLEPSSDLSNNFFNKLSQSIFERDSTYKLVKSRGSAGNKRLVCIKKRLHSPLGGSHAPPKQNTSTQPTPVPNSNLAPGGSIKQWLNSSPNKHSPPTAAVNQYNPVMHQMPPPQLHYPRFNQPRPVFHRPPAQMQQVQAGHRGKLSNKELLNLSRNQGKPNLRPIIIDGPNVAVSHGNGNAFSCRGIAICVNYFWSRGHRDVTCFVPNYRKGSKGHPPTIDQEIIYDLESQGILKITPSREVNGRNVVCYDDGFVLNLAVQNDGVIVSNDQYRDLRDKDDFRRVIDKNLLMYTFVGDLFMPPDDPCGRNGPNLDQFLSFATNQRAPPPNTIFSGNPRMQPNSWGSVKNQSRWLTPSQGSNLSRPMRPPLPSNPPFRPPPPPIPSTSLPPERRALEKSLIDLFPNKPDEVRQLLRDHPFVNDLALLVDFLL